jgi:hypothetical protein
MAAAPAEEMGKDKTMATQATDLTTGMGAAKAMPMSQPMKRRSISPETGRALVILGHAVEYLTDEFVHEGGLLTANRGQIDAIQLLIKLNRQIYMSCPEAGGFGEWLRSFVGGRAKESSQERKVPSGFTHGRI